MKNYNMGSAQLLWTVTIPDGTISKLANTTASSECLLAAAHMCSPLEATSVSFTLEIIKELQDADQESKSPLPPLPTFHLSSYFPNSDLAVTHLSAVIGLTSSTPVDRLVELALMKMIPGETGLFQIQPAQSQLCLTIKVALISIKEESVTELHSLPASSLLRISTQLKLQGVELFDQKRPRDAFFKFGKALKYLILIDDKDNSRDPVLLRNKDELMTTLRNNLAGCHFSSSSNNWDAIISLCDKVLFRDVHNVKALYRRGCAFLEIQEYEKARSDFYQVKQLDPSNALIDSKLTSLHKKEVELNQKYSSAFRKMFA